MNQVELESLTRKALQELAKENGLKANKKSADLISELLEIFSQTKSNKTEDPIQPSIPPPSPPSQTSLTIATISIPSLIQKPEKASSDFDVGSIQISDEICFVLSGEEQHGKIKRINKLSIRVLLTDSTEATIQKSDIIGYYEEPMEIVEPEAAPSIEQQQPPPTFPAEPQEVIQEVTQDVIQEEAIQEHQGNSHSDVPFSGFEEETQGVPHNNSGFCDSISTDTILEPPFSGTFVETVDNMEDSYESSNEDIELSPNIQQLEVSSSPHSPIPLSSTLPAFPSTPKSHAELKRNSLIKSTKAQRARAEAIALKQERLSAALALDSGTLNQFAQTTTLNPPKSPFLRKEPMSFHQKNIHSGKKAKKMLRTSTFPLSNPSVLGSANCSSVSTQKRSSTIHSNSSTTPKMDRIALANEAKLKANSYLQSRSGSKTSKSSSGKVPNFKKLHEDGFNKQKPITQIVGENHEIQTKLTVAMKQAFDESTLKISPPLPVGPFSNVQEENPFSCLLSTSAENRENIAPRKESIKTLGTTEKTKQRRENFKNEGKVLRANKLNQVRGVGAK